MERGAVFWFWLPEVGREHEKRTAENGEQMAISSQATHAHGRSSYVKELVIWRARPIILAAQSENFENDRRTS